MVRKYRDRGWGCVSCSPSEAVGMPYLRIEKIFLDYGGRDLAGHPYFASQNSLDEALIELSRIQSQAGQVVEMRFFGGLSIGETAEVLQVSPETVQRDWRLAKAWLAREVGKE